MSYRDRLNHWLIVRHLSHARWVIVGRYRRRIDADEHCRFLRQRLPNAEFEVVFAPSDSR